MLAAGLMGRGPAAADDMVRFSIPATATGIRGGTTAIYHGWATPRSRFNFQTNAAFIDPDLPGYAVMIAKNGDNQIDPVTDDEAEGSDTHELLVGLSADGGETFSFHRVLKWRDGMRLVRVAMVPDSRRGRHQVWVGIAQVWRNKIDSVKEEFVGITRLEIDWPARKVRLLAEDLTSWEEHPFGAEDVLVPGLLETNIQFTHLARVVVDGRRRWEAWASVPVDPPHDPTGAHLPAPCDDEAVYDQNMANWGWDRKGRRIGWARFYPNTGVDLGSWKLIDSSVRLLPTRHQRSDQQVIRGELGNEEFLFVGTQDQIVCNETVSRNSDGATIRFIALQHDPVGDNYTEVEHDYLLDISNPTGPNWTCEDDDVRCFGTRRQHYDNVSAVPLRHAGRFQLYVGAWGTDAPTLPAIGEAGRVTASDAGPTTVDLIRTYDDPVVFVQPPSYNRGAPVIARVSGVTASSFQVRLQRDTGLTASHGSETLSYVVLEVGTYRLRDKRVLEVAREPISATIPSTLTWTSSLDLKDSHDVDTGAVILTQLQSMNDPYYAKTRQTGPPTITDLDDQCNTVGVCGAVRVATASVAIERDQASHAAGQAHGVEQMGVLLIGEKWIGRSSSVFNLGPWGAGGFDVRRVTGIGGILNLGWTSLTFEQPRGQGALSDPVLLAWSETWRGRDPANVRYRSLTSTGVQLGIDEDQSLDAERNHARENVVYWVLGRGSGLIRAQPIEPEVDRMF